IAESFGKDSLKTQLRLADKMGANYALILGQKEALEESIIIRAMRTGRQQTVKLDKVVREMEKYLKK
ncbi:MAG: Histidine-tRNA ligase, partial [Parcubacteria group bacterium GW2011_GWF2_43_11]